MDAQASGRLSALVGMSWKARAELNRKIPLEKMANLCIVESPFQLISALEAKETFRGFSVLIVRYGPEESNNAQMRQLVGLAPWGKILEVGEGYPVERARRMACRLLLEMKRRAMKWKLIFLGEPRAWDLSRLINLFAPEKIYLLDDGNITLMAHAEWRGGLLGRFRFLRKMGMRKWAVVDFFCELILLPAAGKYRFEDYAFFTCFDLAPSFAGQAILRHSFDNLVNVTTNKDKKGGEVLFFGGPLSELKIVPRNYELDSLASIKSYYERHGQQLVYVPHRRESEEKLEAITALSIEIEKFTSPAEVAVLTRPHLPGGVASFYSTALYAVSRLLKHTPAAAFLLDRMVVAERFRDEVDCVYREYEKTLRVISLEACTSPSVSDKGGTMPKEQRINNFA